MTITKIDGTFGRQNIEAALGVKGEAITPQALDSGLIRFNYETSQFHWMEDVSYLEVSGSCAGASSTIIHVCGPRGALLIAAAPQVVLNNQNAKILFVQAQLSYDAAGLAADIAAGAYNRWNVVMQPSPPASYTFVCSDFVYPVAGQLSYVSQIMARIPCGIYCPWNFSLGIRWTHTPGNWPANTTHSVSAIVQRQLRGYSF